MIRAEADIFDSATLTAPEIASNFAQQYLGLRIRIVSADTTYATRVAYVSAVVGSTIQFQYVDTFRHI